MIHDSSLGVCVPITPHRSSFESTRGVFRLSPTPFSLHPTRLSKPAHYEMDHPPARPPSRIDDDAPSRDGVATSHACESCPTANTKSKPLNPPTPAPPTRCPCRPVRCARVVSWCVHGAPRAMRRRARRVDSCSGETRATREGRRARAMERWDNFRSFARRRGHASNAIARAWRRSRTRRRTARGNPGDIGIGARRLTVERTFSVDVRRSSRVARPR